MTVSAKSLGIDQLNIEERIALIEEIWAGICAEEGGFSLTSAQRAELDRRIAEDDAFPENVTPWEEIKAATRARLGQ